MLFAWLIKEVYEEASDGLFLSFEKIIPLIYREEKKKKDETVSIDVRSSLAFTLEYLKVMGGIS
jgi:hypothetical protein